MNFDEILARLQRDAVDTFKEFTGAAAAERAEIERLKREAELNQGFMDKITIAARNAVNTGFENGQLVVAGVSGLAKQLADRYADTVKDTCGENFACNQAFAYLPYILAFSTLAIVLAAVAKTDVAKKTASALAENVSLAVEKLTSTVKPAAKPASTVTIELIEDSELKADEAEAVPGYFSTIRADLAQKLQSLKDRLAAVPVIAIEDKEEEVAAPVEDVPAPVAPSVAEEATTNPTYVRSLYGR